MIRTGDAREESRCDDRQGKAAGRTATTTTTGDTPIPTLPRATSRKHIPKLEDWRDILDAVMWEGAFVFSSSYDATKERDAFAAVVHDPSELPRLDIDLELSTVSLVTTKGTSVDLTEDLFRRVTDRLNPMVRALLCDEDSDISNPVEAWKAACDGLPWMSDFARAWNTYMFHDGPLTKVVFCPYMDLSDVGRIRFYVPNVALRPSDGARYTRVDQLRAPAPVHITPTTKTRVEPEPPTVPHADVAAPTVGQDQAQAPPPQHFQQFQQPYPYYPNNNFAYSTTSAEEAHIAHLEELARRTAAARHTLDAEERRVKTERVREKKRAGTWIEDPKEFAKAKKARRG